MEEPVVQDFVFILGAIFIGFSLLMSDMARFRLLFLISTFIFLVYGILADSSMFIAMSLTLLIINAYYMFKFSVSLRPVKLPEKLAEIHDIYTPYISTGEFQYLIDLSRRKTFFKEVLVEEGQSVTELMLVLSGTVDVISDGKIINSLGPGNFIGEFGILTGHAASASVRCNSLVEVSIWRKSIIHHEKKLGQLISINLVNKLINVNKHQVPKSTPTKSL